MLTKNLFCCIYLTINGRLNSGFVLHLFNIFLESEVILMPCCGAKGKDKGKDNGKDKGKEKDKK